jgi:hypothetical protein
MTQEELKQILFYCAITGHFTWLKNRFASKIGTIAGLTSDKFKYKSIGINGSRYYAHRLAWLYVYGYFPDDGIDHINGDKTDNRIANLRIANHSENAQNLNKYKRNTSGYTGVIWHKGANKWQARITVNHKMIHLGLFDTREESYAAYLKAKNELHTFNPTQR